MKQILLAILSVIILILLFVASFIIINKRNAGEDITNFPSDGTNIIAFGDSLVFGVGSTDGNNFVDALSERIYQPIINMGVSGDTTRDGLRRIDDVLENDPKIVLLLLGGNDFLQRISKDETFANLSVMIRKIHEQGAVVVLLGVRGGILTDEYEKGFERLVKQHKTAYVPNVLDGLLGNSEFMHDTVHPNDEGYKRIAAKIYPVIIEVLD